MIENLKYYFEGSLYYNLDGGDDLTTMMTSNTNPEGVLARRFKRVRNGLDEAEVLSAIEGLIEQNKDLTDRFAHIDSLTQLAQRSVIQAEQVAESIKKDAEIAATSKADSIIASAEQAKLEADRVIAEIRQRAEEAAHEMVTSAEGKAEEIVRAAETQAQQRAAEIMKAAEDEAQQRTAEITKAAEDDAQRRVEEIVKAAEVRGQLQVEELLSRGRELLVRTTVERFKKFVEDLVSDAKEIEI